MSEELTKDEIEHLLRGACEHLYKNHKHLIDEAAHEESIVADVLVPYLRLNINDYDVTTGYNREGELESRETKTDLEGHPIVPDIIIHRFGPKGPNTAAIEVKGYWNHQDRKEDEDSLQRLAAKHKYKYLYRLELGRQTYELISVVPK
jgi:hypothetical protein